MRTSDIWKEIERLPISKRIYVVEKTIHSIRAEEEENELIKAVEALCGDYKVDAELTAFIKI